MRHSSQSFTIGSWLGVSGGIADLSIDRNGVPLRVVVAADVARHYRPRDR